MNIVSLIGIVLVMCVLIVTVGEVKPEISLLLAIACGIVLTICLLSYVSPLIDEISSIAKIGGVEPELVSIALKAVGICVSVQIASDVCRDSGQSALASKLELGGRLALLIVALPLFRRLLNLAVEIIGK